jgi:hypothetical protein
MGEWRYSSTIHDLVSFLPLPLYPRGKTPGTHWIRGWVGTRAGLDAVEKRKILHCRVSNSGHPARSPSLSFLFLRCQFSVLLLNILPSNLGPYMFFSSSNRRFMTLYVCCLCVHVIRFRIVVILTYDNDGKCVCPTMPSEG